MAAPVFFIDPATEASVDASVSVTGDEARHAAQVTRLRPGEPVDLVDGEGRRVRCAVTAVTRDRVDALVEAIEIEPEPVPRVIVIQALAKGDRGERAVEAMTEVGVDVIVPWQADHCVTRWSGERADRGVAKWRSTARTSTKQARRARVPAVADLHSTRDLAPWLASAALAIALDESADAPVARMDVPEAGDIVLVVGPEGGLSDAEMAWLIDHGATPGMLGPTVLRTSTAGPVGAATVLSRTARWGAGARSPRGMSG